MPPSTKLILVFGRTGAPSPWDVLIPYLSLWESSGLNRGPPPSGSFSGPCEHSLPDCLVWCSPRQACGLPTRRGSTPMVPAQGQHSSLPAALCPSLCWPLRTKIYNRVPAIKESQCAERGSSPHTDAKHMGQTLGNWPPTPRLRGRRESLLEKRGLRWASEYLKVEEQKGLLQQKERAKEGRRERAMSNKAGLPLRQDMGEGEVLSVQHPLREACVHPVYDGNQGSFGSRKLTWLESVSNNDGQKVHRPENIL